MSEANKAVVRRAIDEAWNKGKVEILDEIMARDYAHREPHLPELRGLEDYKQHIVNAKAAFPDMRFSIDEMIAEGDKVAVRWRFTGTHAGKWGGINPTGKAVTVTGMSLHRLVDGKVVDGLIDLDALGMYEQLGLVTDPAKIEANKALVRRFGEDVINEGNLELVDAIFTSDVMYRGTNKFDLRGTAAVKQFITAMRAAFADFRFTFIGELVGQGDLVICRWTATGTHKGEWMGIAPTGNQMTYGGTTTFKVAEGKIAEHWADWDALGMLQQLGAISPLGQARAAVSAAGASAHLDGPDA